MAASSNTSAHRNLYRNNDNPSVVVEFLSTAEMRVGETRLTERSDIGHYSTPYTSLERAAVNCCPICNTAGRGSLSGANVVPDETETT